MKKFALYLMVAILAMNFAVPASSIFASGIISEKPENQDSNFLKNQNNSLPNNQNRNNIFLRSDKESNLQNIENLSNSEQDEKENSPNNKFKKSLIISEIAPRICAEKCTKTDNDSFIEIYNSSEKTIEVSGWTIEYLPAESKNFENWREIAQIDQLEIAPNSYVAVKAWPGSKDAGYLRILDETSETIDLVGYGEVDKLEDFDSEITVINIQSTPKIPKNFSAQLCKQAGAKNSDNLWIVGEKITPAAKNDCEKNHTDKELPIEEDDEKPEILPPKNDCLNLKLNEIGANLTEQFIELKNDSSQKILLAGCQIATNRNQKTFVFSDNEKLAAGDLRVIKVSETDLSLTKTTKGEVFILNSTGDEVDSQKYENLKKDTSFARFSDGWNQTFLLTIGKENILQKFPSCDAGYFYNQKTGRCKKNPESKILTDCPAGYTRNPETNRCRKIAKKNILAACPVGYFRNPETNRCKKIATNSSELKPCPAGYFRNPETNRCKKKSSKTETKLKKCAPGYERNPETNRCRKVKSSSGENAKFALEEIPATKSKKTFWWLAAAMTILAFIALLIWQYRFEIGQLFTKIFAAKKSDKSAKKPEKVSKNLEKKSRRKK